MRRFLSFAKGLLTLCVASSFEIQEGCRVRERIEEKEFLFDSLDFLAIFPGSQMELKVLVQCRERSDLIHISSDNITWNKKQKGTQTTEAASIPLAHGITGWERFTLSLKDKLTLEDRQNHSWVPFDIPLSCHPQDVSIIGKHLTRQCSPQTPTWVVKDKKVDIPLYEGSEGVREALTLFSLLPFGPTFSICDASFSLGLRNEKLVTGSEPLEGSAYSLSLSVLPDNTLKVESEGVLLVSNSLEATPKSMEILGREGDKFVVVQHLPRRFADETEDVGQLDEKEDKCHKHDALTWTLAGCVATMIVAFLVLLIIHYLSRRTNKLGNSTSIQPACNTVQPEATPLRVPSTAQGPPPAPGPPVSSTPPKLCHLGHRAPSNNLSRKSPAAAAHLTSQTLSEISLPGPSWPPFPADLGARDHEGDDEQAVYFEMDLCTGTLPPPKSYALPEVHCETEETINDMYQSAG
ncbi:uncharacterized protein LOC134769807 [Penaeus indicus]|uniref:uncharacterized protein LOC134769807 n=1 Tax=Penaeus indicus TaxID=29960 RepID=UPI00300DB5DE